MADCRRGNRSLRGVSRAAKGAAARAGNEVVLTNVEVVLAGMFVDFWASRTVGVLADDEGVFLERMVDMGWGKVAETRTLHNRRNVAAGGPGV